MKDKKKINFINTWISIYYLLRIMCRERCGKYYCVIKIFASLISSFSPFIFTIFPGLIINELISNKRVEILVLYLSIITIIPVFITLVLLLLNRYLEKLSVKIKIEIDDFFYSHYASMDYETIENPDIGIMSERTRSTLDNAISMSNKVIDFFTAIIKLIVTVIIVGTLNPILSSLVIISTIVSTLITKKADKKKYEIGKEISRADQYQSSALHMLYMGSYAKEIRLFNLKDFLMNHYKKYRSKYDKLRLKSSKIDIIEEIAGSIISFMQQVAMYIYLFFEVLVHNLSVGNMTIYISVVSQLTNTLSGVFQVYADLLKTSLRINEARSFLSIPLKQLESGDKKPSYGPDSIIEFKNVSFKYPGSEKYAIKNLNLKICGNEKICIVGVNGAGKSTFIKLLTRLYWPTEGDILLNGISIYDYKYEEYLKLFSPVFQDFCGYFMSLKENIVLNNVCSNQKLDDVCEKCGLTEFVLKQKKGFDVQIGKWVDEEGINPSGGEFQKIVIARALCKDAPFYLLDEPTAALDPLIEYEIYKYFNKAINNKAAIIISHRLSAAQLADRVVVIDDGQLIESGTHSELYNIGGKYKEMFDKQSEFYLKAKKQKEKQEK